MHAVVARRTIALRRLLRHEIVAQAPGALLGLEDDCLHEPCRPAWGGRVHFDARGHGRLTADQIIGGEEKPDHHGPIPVCTGCRGARRMPSGDGESAVGSASLRTSTLANLCGGTESVRASRSPLAFRSGAAKMPAAVGGWGGRWVKPRRCRSKPISAKPRRSATSAM